MSPTPSLWASRFEKKLLLKNFGSLDRVFFRDYIALPSVHNFSFPIPNVNSFIHPESWPVQQYKYCQQQKVIAGTQQSQSFPHQEFSITSPNRFTFPPQPAIYKCATSPVAPHGAICIIYLHKVHRQSYTLFRPSFYFWLDASGHDFIWQTVSYL